MSLPNWLDKGMVMISNHEPLSFRVRRGGQRTDEKERFEAEHSEEFVKAAAAFGITIIRTHYFKGSGLRHEEPEIAVTRRFIKLCHKYGLKVQGYVQHGTISYETLFDEVPSAKDWVARDQYGLKSSVTYGYQFFRYKPCYNQRGFIDYIKKVVAQGIKDGLDMFGFDNSAWSVEPVACQCDTCKKKFIEFLNKKYRINTAAGKKTAWERFALDTFDHVQPPNWHRWAMPINLYDIEEPMIQEWVDFKCETIRENLEEINAHAKKLKPDIVMEWNCYSASGDNGPFWVGVDIYRNMKHVDTVFNEQDPGLRFNEDGVLLSKIRSFKVFNAYGKYMFSDNNFHAKNIEETELSHAEHLAFNSGMLGRPPVSFSAADLDLKKHPLTANYIKFQAAHRELYTGAVAASQTAVLESYDTLANTRISTHHSLIATYQTLLLSNIQYDILTLDLLDKLPQYKVVILPNVKLLSDAHAEKFMDFVKKGGKLVVTEQTGVFDNWFRARPTPYFAGKEGKQGKGEVFYLAKLEHESSFSYRPEDWYVDPRMWKLPRNHKELSGAVRRLLGKDPLLEVDAPYGVISNLTRRGGEYFLHLINCDIKKTPGSAKVALGPEVKAKNIEVFVPGKEPPEPVSFAVKAGRVTFSTGKLARYSIFRVKAG